METEMKYGSDYHFLPVTSIRSGEGIEIKPDLFQLTVQIVNVAFIGDPDRGDWLLVDAGMPNRANEIIEAAEGRFGIGNPPKAIVLTHGHFDHVGSVIECIEHWNVDVWAHEAELPYLTGKKAYMTPDPSSAAGLVAKMSPWFPNEPILLGNRVHALPKDGGVPHLSGWRWLLTNGHTPGHVSLFQDGTGALVAGDAFVTVKQESVYKVFLQELEINGPPKYFTSDWQAAKQSVMMLAKLNPTMAITGHGKPVEGEALASGLQRLWNQFDTIALPKSSSRGELAVNSQQTLAAHESLDLHEALNFKTLCLAKSKFMQGLVFDQELRDLMEKDVRQAMQDVADLQAVYKKAPFHAPIPEFRPTPIIH